MAVRARDKGDGDPALGLITIDPSQHPRSWPLLPLLPGESPPLVILLLVILPIYHSSVDVLIVHSPIVVVIPLASLPRRNNSNIASIGRPHTFVTGPLASCTVRMELEEIQKPDLGRKFARKDKRPLDPPPVILCRFFESLSGPDGRHIEVEMPPAIPYRQGSTRRVTITNSQAKQRRPMDANAMAQTTALSSSGTVSSLRGATTPNYDIAQIVTSSASATLPSEPSTLVPYADDPSTFHGAHVVPDPAAVTQWQEAAIPAAQTLERDIVATFGDFQICESSKCSDALSGTTSTHAEVIDYKGKKSAVFVFSDVAVKSEGTFVLRYRLFNILSKVATGSPAPALAECFGGPFKIYSSKEFPGLQASTELTKSLALYGVRVNMRETPRRRRRDSEMPDGTDGQGEEETSPRQILPDGYHNHPRTAAAARHGRCGCDPWGSWPLSVPDVFYESVSIGVGTGLAVSPRAVAERVRKLAPVVWRVRGERTTEDGTGGEG
ncbi:LOW QUALITY PROTEIN: hypothetical protein ACG7TL_001991 [Trametes sanguinea]